MKTKILTDFQICIGIPLNMENEKNTENVSSAMYCQLGINLIDGKNFNQTLNQILNITYLSQYMLGEERWIFVHTHLSTHVKCGKPCSGSKNIYLTITGS